MLNHELIGRRVVYSSLSCLVTGARRIDGKQGFSFRLIVLRQDKKPCHEFWTEAAPVFEATV